METYWLCFTLLSDATFGRGEGMTGLVDQEVEHDADGLPYLRGRALKGLLNEECANILYELGAEAAQWTGAAQRLFGAPGSQWRDTAEMRAGDARLPAPLREGVHAALDDAALRGEGLEPSDILDALTTIRHQTAVDEATGAPDDGTLRAMRVVLRQTPFEARLTFIDDTEAADLPLLAACILALRRAGTGRNRGRGRLRATLHADADGEPGEDITRAQFARFVAPDGGK